MNFKEQKIKEQGQGKWLISIEGEEYQKILSKAKNRVKAKIEVPGFRKGKAPAAEVEKFLTPNRIFQEAYYLAIDPAFQFALSTNHEIKPMNNPEPKLSKINDKLMQIEFIFDLVPEIKIGKYTGITTVKKEAAAVDEEEINNELKKYQERFIMEKTRENDQKIVNGDVVIFDFQGFIDGEVFKGGDAKDYSLVIGSKQFVPGFEESMIGLGLGKHSIKVTFPQEYTQDLGGKEATFELDIKEIRERIYPEIDSELIKDLNLKEINTIDELKAKIKDDLITQKAQVLKSQFVNAIVDEIIKTSDIELPKSAIDHQIKDLKKEFEQEVIRQGLTLKDYKKLTNLTDEDIEREVSGDAKTRLQSYLVTSEIRDKEKFDVTDEKILNKYEELAKQFNLPLDHLKKILPESQIREELLSEAITDFLYQNNG